jgi:hypothetical protein
MYRYSLEERVFIVKTYWITGSIKDCQRRFVEQFGGRNPSSKRCIQLLVAGCVAVSFRVDYLYLILSFRVANFLFANSQSTQPHFITGMTANVLYFCSFCKPTFSGATREWDAHYNTAHFGTTCLVRHTATERKLGA